MKFLLLSIAFLALVFLAVRFIEYRTTYYPFRHIEYTPDDLGLTFQEVTIETSDDETITGWYVPAGRDDAVILLAHGNGGNISHRLEKIKILNGLGLDVMIFDYRGYGRSSGRPSEKGLYRDAEAVYDYLVGTRGVSERGIIGYGESLGGAIIVELAVRRDMGGIILEDSFTTLPDMGKLVFPFIPSFLLEGQYDSESKVGGLTVPIMIMHSIEDEIVPFSQGRRLYEAASEPKEFVQLQGGHNDAFLVSLDLYRNALDYFVKSVRSSLPEVPEEGVEQ